MVLKERDGDLAMADEVLNGTIREPCLGFPHVVIADRLTAESAEGRVARLAVVDEHKPHRILNVHCPPPCTALRVSRRRCGRGRPIEILAPARVLAIGSEVCV